jgi:hypothetical protein
LGRTAFNVSIPYQGGGFKTEVVSEILAADGSAYEVPAFKLNGHIVWGATAMMLIEIKSMLNQILKK